MFSDDGFSPISINYIGAGEWLDMSRIKRLRVVVWDTTESIEERWRETGEDIKGLCTKLATVSDLKSLEVAVAKNPYSNFDESLLDPFKAFASITTFSWEYLQLGTWSFGKYFAITGGAENIE